MRKIGNFGLAVLAWAGLYQPLFGQYGYRPYVSNGYATYPQPTLQTPVVWQPAYQMVPAPALAPAPQGPSQVGRYANPVVITVSASQPSWVPQPPSCVAPPTVPAPSTPSTTQPAPQTTTPTPQPTEAPTTETAAPADVAPFGAEGGAAVGGETVGFGSPGGYLDDAIPRSQFRLRYDDQLNINRPDRAEYLYAAWKEMSFHAHGILVNGVFTGVFLPTNALGPVQAPGQLDVQQISGYLEYAVNNRLSGFVDLPVDFLHFRGVQEGGDEGAKSDQNSNSKLNEQAENQNPDNTPNGLSDITFGFKYALIADPDQYLTFQGRAYAPTGDPRTGLGTGHWSFEPGLLYLKRCDRLAFQAELEDWIPVGGGPMEGNVLTYGLGLAYDVYERGNLKVTPVTEVVGWTVLGGFESFFIPGGNIPTAPGLPVPPGLTAQNTLPIDHGVISATGDTIVNIKFGVRTYFGEHSDIYVGYGRCVTGDRWYKDIYRVEYRFKF